MSNHLDIRVYEKEIYLRCVACGASACVRSPHGVSEFNLPGSFVNDFKIRHWECYRQGQKGYTP